MAEQVRKPMKHGRREGDVLLASEQKGGGGCKGAAERTADRTEGRAKEGHKSRRPKPCVSTLRRFE
eukprot:2438466-Alexandrium_andersonii.AAC.1